MLYIGYKKKSLDFISETLKDYCTFPLKIVADLFAGTGVVSFYLGNLPDTEHIVSNDIQYYSYVLLRAQLENHSHHILPGENVKKGFIYDNYAVDRRYFTPDNAQLIDGYRSVINNDDYYSIASLLVGVSEISNTACMYESYLKSYKKSSLKKLEPPPEVSHHPLIVVGAWTEQLIGGTSCKTAKPGKDNQCSGCSWTLRRRFKQSCLDSNHCCGGRSSHATPSPQSRGVRPRLL